MPPELASGNTGSWIIYLPAPLLVRLLLGITLLYSGMCLCLSTGAPVGLEKAWGQKEKRHTMCVSVGMLSL